MKNRVAGDPCPGRALRFIRGRMSLALLRLIWRPVAIALAVGSCDLQGVEESQPIDSKPRNGEKRSMTMPPAQLDAKLQAMVEDARADLLRRRERERLSTDDITLLRAERVTWRTSALGCPLPDRMYKMVLTPGVLILLRAGGHNFEYHSSLQGPPFLCEPPGRIESPAPGGHALDPT